METKNIRLNVTHEDERIRTAVDADGATPFEMFMAAWSLIHHASKLDKGGYWALTKQRAEHEAALKKPAMTHTQMETLLRQMPKAKED